jgi:hypothetical protein
MSYLKYYPVYEHEYFVKIVFLLNIYIFLQKKNL